MSATYPAKAKFKPESQTEFETEFEKS
jgi:hypothetical protein